MSVKYEKGICKITEGDLDPLKIIVLEQHLCLYPGTLINYGLVDWVYREEANRLVLIFKEGFNWPCSPREFDPHGMDRNRIVIQDGMTLIPFYNIY